MIRTSDRTPHLVENWSLGGVAQTGLYRPEIDGLRAVAVVAVLVFHAFPIIVPGGFIGVDIFFVISGYLITSIIDRRISGRDFSVVKFYARRILRIIPALVIVILATFSIGWFILPVAEMQSLGISIKGAAALIQNFVLHEQLVGYFDASAERLPLLHLWSLGIEEQYYIVWPAALLLISHWPRRKTAFVAACAIGSFVLCIMIPAHELAWTFYSPTARAWEFLAGSLLALRSRENAQASDTPRLDALLASLGLAAIVLGFWVLNSRMAWPGFLTTVPVLATVALLATRDTCIHRALSARFLVSIGLISYPLYLWHFPLIAFARIYANGPVSAPVILALLAVSFPLAWLTYRFVERPLRFGNGVAGFRVAPLLTAVAAIWLVGMVVVDTRGLPVRFPKEIRGFMLSGSETWLHWRRGRCLLLLQPPSAFTPDCAGRGNRPLLLVWGDSYAAASYPGLLDVGNERGYDIAQYTASACPPLLGYSLPERPFCKGVNDDVLLRIGRLRPDVVILQATWGHSEAILRQDLPRTIAQLRAMNISNIVLMGPLPGWRGGLPASVVEYYRETRNVLPERSFYHSMDEWTRGRDALLRQLADQLDIRFISVRDVFCNENGCLTRVGPNGSQLVAFDAGHLTVPGATFLARRIIDRIAP